MTVRPTDPAMVGPAKYERVEGDFYATPPENLDCLAHFLDLWNLWVWECACGEGALSIRMKELGAPRGVISTDLFDRGYGTPNIDFLACQGIPPKLLTSGQPAIITNPPYGELAEQFVRHALQLMKVHNGIVAMFLRNEWDMASGRTDLFENPAYRMKVCVTKRPRWKPFEKGDKSPRHNYAWYVWDFRKNPSVPGFIRFIHPKKAKPLGCGVREEAA